MQSLLVSLVLVCVLVFAAEAYVKDDEKLVELCKNPSNREICEYLLQQQPFDDYEHAPMEKRKPSFVRFGKRSSSNFDQDVMLMNKRKPSFVRFG